jgi:AAA family ATP:ADP antiporter
VDARTDAGWRQFVRRLVDVDADELAAVLWAWLFFFSALSAYYVIRPIRDDMGVAGGVENLPWLFTGSLVGTLILNVPFSWLVSRLPRARFISATYRFFALNLVVFFVILRTATPAEDIWIGRAFFIWTSVFNMFIVALFWSVMADVFSPAQSKRLFGFISAGGQIGAISGAAITSGLVGMLGPARLMIVSAVLLEVAAFAARRLFLLKPAAARHRPAVDAPEPVIGGTAWDGFKRALTSPFLLSVSLHTVLYTVLTTFLYFQQASLVDAAFTDRALRTRFFANIDLGVNVLTLLTQLFVTARIVQVFGLTAALVFLPALSLIGFTALGLVPTVTMLMAFQILRRSGNFAIAQPARASIFTVVSPGDRYKVKTFIDTFVYRAGDQVAAWAYAPLAALGAGVAGISTVAAGVAIVSIANATWLGRRAHVESSGLDASGSTQN